MPTVSVLLIAALTGALITGAHQTGVLAVHGTEKAVHAIHHHVHPVKATKAVINHETK